MYSCQHCEVVNSNRNSFNRHLREHLGTDVQFLNDKISEEVGKVDLENKGVDFSVEPEKSDRIETKIQTSDPDLEELVSGVTTDDISSILERYQHINSDEVKHEEPVAEDNDESDLKMELEHVENVYHIESRHDPVVEEITNTKRREFKLEETVDENEEREEMYPKKESLGQRKKKSNAGKPSSCPECGKNFKNKNSMKIHFSSIHHGMKYPCNQCDYQATYRSNLSSHVMNMHIKRKAHKKSAKKLQKNPVDRNLDEKVSDRLTKKKSKSGKSFFCPECGKGFTQQNNMKIHYRTVHKGLKYPCIQCDYQATYPGNLQKHIRNVHDGIKRKRPVQTGN